MGRARAFIIGLVAVGVLLVAACTPPTSGGGGGGGTPNVKPHAVATADVTSGFAPLTVEFTGAASSDSDGTVAAFAWTFGDGNTSTEVNPTHVYAEAGPYTASLKVTCPEGRKQA